jgi:hypothetical protein
MKKIDYSSVKKPNLSALDSDIKKYLGDPKRIFSEQREIYLSGYKTRKSKKSILTRDINTEKKYLSYLTDKMDKANSKGNRAMHLGKVINSRKLNEIKTNIRVLEKIRKELDIK